MDRIYQARMVKTCKAGYKTFSRFDYMVIADVEVIPPEVVLAEGNSLTGQITYEHLWKRYRVAVLQG